MPVVTNYPVPQTLIIRTGNPMTYNTAQGAICTLSGIKPQDSTPRGAILC